MFTSHPCVRERPRSNCRFSECVKRIGLKNDKVVKWTNEGSAPTYVGLSTAIPGKVIPVDLMRSGSLLVKPQMFLCRYDCCSAYTHTHTLPTTNTNCCVCTVCTLNRYFYNARRYQSVRRVSVLIFHPREIQSMWSQNVNVIYHRSPR